MTVADFSLLDHQIVGEGVRGRASGRLNVNQNVGQTKHIRQHEFQEYFEFEEHLLEITTGEMARYRVKV